MASEHKGLILLTGATGFVGFRTMMLALQAGYHVRAATRSDDKAQTVLNHPAIKSLHLPANVLTFVTVPDIEASGAYNEAIKGASYAIHVASPLPLANKSRDPKDGEETFVRPAVAATLNMLEAASSEPSIRRVVITSSVTALLPPKDWITESTGRKYTERSRQPLLKPPYPSNMHAYLASKTAALNATESWVAEHKPSFAVVNVHPGFILGRVHMAQKRDDLLSSTNSFALAVPTGVRNEPGKGGSAIHVDDVARALLAGLDYVKVAEGSCQSLLLGVPADWEGEKAIVAKYFPDAVRSGLLPNNGIQPLLEVDLDGSASEKMLGFTFQSFEEQVKSIVAQYVDMS